MVRRFGWRGHSIAPPAAFWRRLGELVVKLDVGDIGWRRLSAKQWRQRERLLLRTVGDLEFVEVHVASDLAERLGAIGGAGGGIHAPSPAYSLTSPRPMPRLAPMVAAVGMTTPACHDVE